MCRKKLKLISNWGRKTTSKVINYNPSSFLLYSGKKSTNGILIGYPKTVLRIRQIIT